ncbi:uncharacterized protein PAC_02709 [Phialocephala subalpina]|uniref:HNH nuclease domain-containing protein n=1 Tax=Phialocephala subalpina TaxID=576137 RepID=A0A1L7WJ90_9HELO|nr:uncharacterized protein PAC_02709 [Phialocephala subalpina]
MGRLPIRERMSSVLPTTVFESFKKRKASNESKVPLTTSVAEFIALKEKDLEIDINMGKAAKEELDQEYKRKKMSAQVFQEQCAEIEAELSVSEKEKELLLIQTQYKFIREDLQEVFPGTDLTPKEIEAAYASLLCQKAEAATNNNVSASMDFKQGRFRKAVLDRYGAVKVEGGLKYHYCLLTGWCPMKPKKLKQDGTYEMASDVVAARLVPKFFEGDDLNYIYGVGNALLSDPRNGLPLHDAIEKQLDAGNAVIVPHQLDENGLQSFKLWVVCGELLKTHWVNNEKKWADVNGQVLQFLNRNRPQRRYLYFKFITTYLKWKRLNNTDKVAMLDAIGAKETLWATPDGYLRRSTLHMLFRQANIDLPENLTEDTTFEDSKYSKARSPEEENMHARTLARKSDQSETAEDRDRSGSDDDS